MNDVQKAEAIASTETQIEQAKSQFEIQRMESQESITTSINGRSFNTN